MTTFSVTEAAFVLEVSPPRVCQLAAAGEIKVTFNDGHPQFALEDVVRLRRERDARGHTRGPRTTGERVRAKLAAAGISSV